MTATANNATYIAEKIAALSAIVSSNPKRAEFASSLMAALAIGKVSDKQAEWIDRLISEAANPAPIVTLSNILSAFRGAFESNERYPKMEASIGGIVVTLSYTAPVSDRAKESNKDTVSIASGKYGDPASKWYGRIGKDGTFAQGRDCTPEILAALMALEKGESSPFAWKRKKSKGSRRY